MSSRNSTLFKTILLLLSLNFFSLYLYFHTPHSKILHLHQHRSTSLRRPSLENHPYNVTHHYSKPWPILPSYLPWSQSGDNNGKDVALGSCEGYFGNGFSQRLDLLNSSFHYGGQRVGGWFKCWYSTTLRSSICEGKRVRMVPEKIHMSKGGEELEKVIGRTEDEEMPEFENGAFEVDGGQGLREGRPLTNTEFLDRYLPQGEILRHAMRALVGSIRVVASKDFTCEKWIEEPTLLVTRYEYANLFHTFTDWYSAYVASRVTSLPNRPHLIFVDGHCTTGLEETWEALFSSLNYAKNFSGPVCFRHVILSPLGYETALFKGLTEEIECTGASAHDLWQNPDNQKTARLSEFGEMIRAAFNFPIHGQHAGRLPSVHNVLFVRREDYLAHPRHRGKVESRLSNEQEVFDMMKSWASTHSECKINIVNGLFAHMSMKEQVRTIQDASVIVGAHGAGMTHIISALPNTIILEIISFEFRRPHFELIARWKGLEYHAINLAGSYADTATVIDRLKGIMSSLGC